MEEFDPNAERSSVVHRDIERVTSSNRLLYQEKKKAHAQLSLNRFFEKADETPSKSAEEPSTSKSASQSHAKSPSASPSSNH
jgi:hypothetical protein